MEDLNKKNPRTTNTLKLSGKKNETNKAIRIVLIDGRELVRRGLRHILELEEDIEVVGDYASSEEALSEMPGLHQNIVLIGAQLPGMDGIEATRSLQREGLNSGGDVIVLAESADYQAEALKAGAASYLLKDITSAELAQTIRHVYWNRRSLEKRNRLSEEVVELVIPPTTNANQLLRFMCQLEEIFHDDLASIICTAGSWNRRTTITILPHCATTPSTLVITLANMPEVEKVEEQPVAKGVLSSLTQKFGVLPRSSISPSKRIRVTLKETDIARQESVAAPD
jgi:DNA-binding NarL/FixJ family response regulator